MIQNPSKKITLNLNVEDVKVIMNKLQYFINDVVKLKLSDDILGEYEFDFSRSMIGNIITVSLNEISENKTEVNMESARVMGSYNHGTEVTTANLDIKSLTSGISMLVQNPDLEIPEGAVDKKKQEEVGGVIWGAIVFIGFCVVMYLIMS